MTEQIAGVRSRALLPETLDRLLADGIVAAQEDRAAIRQAVLRREHDVLNLSVALAQPAPEGLVRPGRGSLTRVQPWQCRMGWADFAQIWASAGPPGVGSPGGDALLGEARLFLARTSPENTGTVEATAELGQSLEPLLPYREDRPRDWWQWGTTTAGGYALWDTRSADDIGVVREIVVVAAANRDDELSAWAWSDGTPGMPPFARYLMHTAKLRCEARVLDAWHRAPSADADIDQVVAEVNVALTPDQPHPGKAELLSSRLSRLRAEEARLTVLNGDLSRLGQTVSFAQRNLGTIPGCGASDSSAGLFAADQALARWLAEQIEGDLKYLQIDLGRTSRVREIAVEELRQAQRTEPTSPPGPAAGATAGEPGRETSSRPPGAAGAADHPDVTRQVFIVHGRDGVLTKNFSDLLRAVRLEPLEWETMVEATGSAAPYLGQVVARAPHLAQATLVLLTPDDVVELHSDLYLDNDPPQERARSGQARPNVLFEFGLALMAYPERTVVVEVGQMRPIADLGGLNVIRFDGSGVAIKKMLDRLKQAGCPVDTNGTDWLDTGRFAGLAAYQRGPGTHDGRR
jgi:predicted nucleotide-binding protein